MPLFIGMCPAHHRVSISWEARAAHGGEMRTRGRRTREYQQLAMPTVPQTATGGPVAAAHAGKGADVADSATQKF